MAMEKQVEPLFTKAEWDFEKIKEVCDACEEIAVKELGLDYFPIQIEIVTSEQMIDAYASTGLPIYYAHWSLGKRFMETAKPYQKGKVHLAYELVINSNPCLVYCMEQNSMTMQAIVIAHAGFGHNAFFKNNHLFRQWTSPDSIIDYMVFARKLLAEYEEKYGVAEVEKVIDACHTLRNHGVDRYSHPPELSVEKEKERRGDRAEQRLREITELYSILPRNIKEDEKGKKDRFPKDPQENILYFIEKFAPELPIWKREVIRIVRKISQYFYPQMQTKVLNEGFATFVHYYTMNRLHEERLITDGSMQEFLLSHTNVVFQPGFDDPRFYGINPYALGFNMFMDIKRICEAPTEEDKEWFPDIAGSDWKKTVLDVVKNYRDESGIRQFLSPALMRDMRLFSMLDDEKDSENFLVTGIHNDDDYHKVRKALADQFDVGLQIPLIEVVNVNRHGDRTLTLHHSVVNNKQLDTNETIEVLDLIESLWEFPVQLVSVHPDGRESMTYGSKKVRDQGVSSDNSNWG